jgi:mercuric ion binding protein
MNQFLKEPINKPSDLRSNILLIFGVLVLGLVLAICCETALADEPSDGLTQKTVTLSVENMTCNMCPYTVRKSLEQVSGVKAAKVDFDSKTATVTFNPGQVGVSKLTEATTNAGYPATQIKQ